MAKESPPNLHRYTQLITYACNTLEIRESVKEKIDLTEKELEFVRYIRDETNKAKLEGRTVIWETPFDYD